MRFHGAQSVLLHITLVVVAMPVGLVAILMPALNLVFLLTMVAWLGLWIVMCIKGYKLEHVKLPLIGDRAEQWAAK